MSSFFFVPILLYIGIPAAFLYVVYRVVDLWVKESLAIRREQNTLLAKLIEALDEKNNKSDAYLKHNTVMTLFDGKPFRL